MLLHKASNVEPLTCKVAREALKAHLRILPKTVDPSFGLCRSLLVQYPEELKVNIWEYLETL